MGNYSGNVNWDYVNRMNSIAQEWGPAFSNVLEQISGAWGINGYVDSRNNQYFDYVWYLEGNGVTIGFELCVSDNLRTVTIGVIKRSAHAGNMGGIPMSDFSVQDNFPLTADGMNQAIRMINERGPRRFLD